ncbi:MAG TPA: hypothetical protein VFG86_17150 [Chloroflexota bacterium]|nr:hypothetical protein [Chloroflexota bacterium]
MTCPDIDSPDGVLIDVRAVGVSFPDLQRSQGLYQEQARGATAFFVD